MVKLHKIAVYFSALALTTRGVVIEAFMPSAQLAKTQPDTSPGTTFVGSYSCRQSLNPLGIFKKDIVPDEIGLEETEGFSFNPLFGGLWLAFLAYGIFFSPGELMDPSDTAIIEAYIENPAAPVGINEIFLAIFNSLGLMPLVIAQLACPQADGRADKIPGAAFLGASMGMGYGAAGCYLAFRAPPVESKTLAEASWVTRNVLENKVFNLGVVALCIFTAQNSGILSGDMGLGSIGTDFLQLASVSKFVSVSTFDLAVLTIAAAALIPTDYALRSESTGEKPLSNLQVQLLAVSTIFLPVLGAACYCAWRPLLPPGGEAK